MNTWSDEDLFSLKELYSTHSNEFLAKKFNRSKQAVYQKAKKIGLLGRSHTDRRLKSPGDASRTFLLNRYKYSAKRRNLSFELTNEQFLNLISQNCHYCGREPRIFNVYEVQTRYRSNVTKERAGILANGIDRINSDNGYDMENCVTCCYTCNIMKNNMSVLEFKKHIEQIYLNFSKEGK